MNHVQPFRVCRDPVDAFVPTSLRRSALVLGFALVMVAVSGEVGAVSSDLDLNASEDGPGPDPSLSQTGIAIETKVFRVAEDGSLEALELERDYQTDDPVVQPNADGGHVNDQYRLNEKETPELRDEITLAGGRMSGNEPVSSSAGVLMTVAVAVDGISEAVPEADTEAQQDDVLESSASRRVVAGDRLRYELIVRNTNKFTVPALELEVIEQLPPDVQLLTEEGQLSNLVATGRVAAAQPAVVVQSAGGIDAEADTEAEAERGPELHEPRALHWVNAQALLPGSEMVLTYEVVVALQSTGQAREDSGNALDSPQTQLQLPE